MSETKVAAMQKARAGVAPFIEEETARAEAAEACVAELKAVVRRVVNCHESQHLPAVLMINARAALQDAEHD